MPIYEFTCRGCHQEFEQLILPWKPDAERIPVCPSCQSQDVEKMMSVFAMNSDTLRKTHLATARKKARKVKQEKDTEEFKQTLEHAAEHH